MDISFRIERQQQVAEILQAPARALCWRAVCINVHELANMIAAGQVLLAAFHCMWSALALSSSSGGGSRGKGNKQWPLAALRVGSHQ